MKKIILLVTFICSSFSLMAQTETEVLPNKTSDQVRNNIRIGYSTGSLTVGSHNSLLGFEAGKDLTTGYENTYIGSQTGSRSSTAHRNTFMGHAAGQNITTGTLNTFMGRASGLNTTTGFGNVFIGTGAGARDGFSSFGSVANTTGNKNTCIGSNAETGANNLSYATAIGANAMVSVSNAVVLGKNDGVVGIGTSSPTAKLEIKSGSSGASGLKFTNLTSGSAVAASNGKVLTVDATGNVILVTDGGGGSSPSTGWAAATVGTNNIINSNTGGVIIGTGITSLPAGYKLYVSDGILAEKAILAVKNTTNWADYVFEADYKLRPLSEVESFIVKNKHLPEVPSATEVVKNGVNVAENQALLLKKIEELTLYVIDQDKLIKDCKEKLELIMSKSDENNK